METPSVDLLSHNPPPFESNAVVQVAVAHLRREPRHAAELVCQALLGEQVATIDNQTDTPADWLYISLENGYQGYVCRENIYEAYTPPIARNMLMVIKPYACALWAPRPKARACLTLLKGCVLAFTYIKEYDYFEGQLPNGQKIYMLKKDCLNLAIYQQENDEFTAQTLVGRALDYSGVPYLWGGNTMAGIDCSGLIYAIARECGVHGFARDTKDQAQCGTQVPNQQELTHGNLLFFGDPATNRINHVAIYIGNGRYIHAAGDSYVRVNSLHATDALYNRARAESYLFARNLFAIPKP